MKVNMKEMGLAIDANQIKKIKGGAKQLIEKRERANKGEPEEEEEEESASVTPGPSSEVVQELEAEVGKFVKKQTFRFPEEDVRWMVAMLDKHGDDFKAMERDPKNMFQLTRRQIQQKIVKFMSIPEQFAPVAKARGLLPEEEKEEEDDDDEYEDMSEEEES